MRTAVARQPFASHRHACTAYRAQPRRAVVSCRALAVGDSLPDFNIETDTCELLSSKDLTRGNGIILFIYPEACTSGCTRQATAFKDNFRAFANKGYAVCGMSADEPPIQAAWKAEHGFPFLLLSDRSKEALAALGVLTSDGKIKRSHFVVAKGGQVLDAQIGISSNDSVPVALAFVDP